jgi:NADH-quinone oxidoreductase subunit E
MTGDAFQFTAENTETAKAVIARYPEGRQQSAVMPLLDLAQRQNGGWLSEDVIAYVADFLAMPRIRAREVASFYTMYHLKPVGRHVVGVCTTTPCWLRGSAAVLDACREATGAEVGGTSEDGLFTLVEVECMGACCNAPMMEIGDHYYEDLDPDSAKRVIEALKRGETPTPGSQTGRRSSEPANGLTTLKDSHQGEGA